MGQKFSRRDRILVDRYACHGMNISIPTKPVSASSTKGFPAAGLSQAPSGTGRTIAPARQHAWLALWTNPEYKKLFFSLGNIVTIFQVSVGTRGGERPSLQTGFINPTYGTILSITSCTLLVPTLTDATSPLKSPLCGVALPDLEIFAPTTTS